MQLLHNHSCPLQPQALPIGCNCSDFCCAASIPRDRLHLARTEQPQYLGSALRGASLSLPGRLCSADRGSTLDADPASDLGCSGEYNQECLCRKPARILRYDGWELLRLEL